MGIYEKLGVVPLINASETYTKLGGSLMAPETLEAMREAAGSFIDLDILLDRVCEKAAQLTHNEGAFVTSGAGAGVVLSAAACIIEANLMDTPEPEREQKRAEMMEAFPFIGGCPRNEVLVFRGNFRRSVPYWKLIGLTGAKIVDVEPTREGILEAACERTAAFFLFPAPLYEQGILPCEQALPVLKELGVRVVVDAAAQLPPPSNLWYYTQELGADVAVFSGGKHIRGPQSTGLIAGRRAITELCRALSSPHERIGRGFKTGKEELAGFITALERFVITPPEAEFDRQAELLERMEKRILENAAEKPKTRMIREGRLGTYQPLLLLKLPGGRHAADCNRYTRARPLPVDVGVYTEEFGMPEDVMFLNAYNLKGAAEADIVADAVTGFINGEKP